MKNKTLLPNLLILSLCLMSQFSNGQAPILKGQKCVGGSADDRLMHMIKLKDGYLSCGDTQSQDGDFTGTMNHGGREAFLMKTNKEGNIIWRETYGGSNDETFYNIRETANGDILAIGTTGSNDGQVTGHHGSIGTDDVWLIKTNKKGDLIKQHCYGGSGSESTYDLGQSEGLLISKKGYILFTAETNSNDGDVSGNHGDYDGWVVKLNPSTFDIITSKTIGDANYDAAYTIHEINGFFLVTGTKATEKNDGSVEIIEAFYKAFATKLDTSTLEPLWYKIYGGSRSDDCNASVVSTDGNLVLTGHAASSDGDCVGNTGFNTWTWKINVNDGGIIWKNFEGEPGDTSAAFNILPTHDGGFAAVGSISHLVFPFLGDGYVVKVDANGKTQWTKRFGGSEDDELLGGVEEKDGNFLLGGFTSSNDGDVSGYHSGPLIIKRYHRFHPDNSSGPSKDIWLVELSRN